MSEQLEYLPGLTTQTDVGSAQEIGAELDPQEEFTEELEVEEEEEEEEEEEAACTFPSIGYTISTTEGIELPAALTCPSRAPPVDTPRTLFKQGAEALLYRSQFLTATLQCLLKHRPSKAYRHPVLDARLTKHRCLSETRLLVRMRRELDRIHLTSFTGITANVPTVYFCDELNGEIHMDWIQGRTVREVLDEATAVDGGFAGKSGLAKLMRDIGTAVAEMHGVDVVHGDLTTSNIMVRPGEWGVVDDKDPLDLGLKIECKGDIFLIDFGLGAVSTSEEDMAVDLHVLERAFVSTHPTLEGLLPDLLCAYSMRLGMKAESVLGRLEGVRMRGRKQSMVG